MSWFSNEDNRSWELERDETFVVLEPQKKFEQIQILIPKGISNNANRAYKGDIGSESWWGIKNCRWIWGQVTIKDVLKHHNKCHNRSICAIAILQSILYERFLRCWSEKCTYSKVRHLLYLQGIQMWWYRWRGMPGTWVTCTH